MFQLLSLVTLSTSSIGLFWTVVALVAVYYYRTFQHWAQRNVLGPRPLPFVGNVYELLFRPVHESQMNHYTTFGQVYGTYEASRPILTVAKPELLRSIMVKDFSSFPDRRLIVGSNKIAKYFLTQLAGNEWKRMRTIMTPTFTSGM